MQTGPLRWDTATDLKTDQPTDPRSAVDTSHLRRQELCYNIRVVSVFIRDHYSGPYT